MNSMMLAEFMGGQLVKLIEKWHSDTHSLEALKRILRYEVGYNLDIIDLVIPTKVQPQNRVQSTCDFFWAVNHLSVDVLAQLFVDPEIGNELISNISNKEKMEEIRADDPTRAWPKMDKEKGEILDGSSLLGYLLNKIRVLKALSALDDSDELLSQVDWNRRLKNLKKSFLTLNKALK